MDQLEGRREIEKEVQVPALRYHLRPTPPSHLSHHDDVFGEPGLQDQQGGRQVQMLKLRSQLFVREKSEVPPEARVQPNGNVSGLRQDHARNGRYGAPQAELLCEQTTQECKARIVERTLLG